MAEPRLAPRSALGSAAAGNAWDGLRVREHLDPGIASIAARRGRAGDVRERVATAHGIALPASPAVAVSGGLRAAWSGHEQWLACSPDAGLAASLGETLAGVAAVTDQGGAWVELRVAGPRARDTLERLCPVDLHPSAFPAGAAARTVMEHLQVLVALLDDGAATGGPTDGGPEFMLLTPSSSARSFHDALLHAARSTCGEAKARA